MTTHRRYVFQIKNSSGHEKAKEILTSAVDQFHWYGEPEITGQPFGYLSVGFTVRARDQWWCHRRAMRLATDVWYAIGLTEKDLPSPIWENLAPHTNRGRYRVPKDQATASD